jgi:hypothetical protein
MSKLDTKKDNNMPVHTISGYPGYDLKNSGQEGQIQRHLPKGELQRKPYLLDR